MLKGDAPRRPVVTDTAGWVRPATELGSHQPLPARLRQVLVDLPNDPSAGRAVALRPRSVPLPVDLRQRLIAIPARDVRRPVPWWLRSGRYAVAASYLLLVLIGAAIGNPIAFGREAGGTATREVNEALRTANARGVDAGRVAAERLNGTIVRARDGLASVVEPLRADDGSTPAREEWIGDE